MYLLDSELIEPKDNPEAQPSDNNGKSEPKSFEHR